jgi:hypothetical protein
MAWCVMVVVASPVGVFNGFASEDFPTPQEAEAKRCELQEMLRSCDTMTIVDAHDTTAEITLTAGVIKNSVFQFKIAESV